MIKFYIIKKKLGGFLCKDIVNGIISNIEKVLKIEKEQNYSLNLEEN